MEAGLQGRVHQAAEAGIEVETHVEPGLAIHADPVAARTVLHNLFDNAIKATALGGGGRVRVEARRRARFVELAVTDTGVGFEPREAARLFEKFYRSGDELRRRSRGSGLGLYLVRSLVEQGGGRVWAESEGPGRGATFGVSWRACASEEALAGVGQEGER